MIQFSMQDLMKAAEREVKQRERVYPRLVENKKMSKETAQFQIEAMQAIADHFRRLANGERLI